MKKDGSKAASNTQKRGTKKRRGPGKPFKKNDPETGEKDPRINRSGAPQIFPELRKMVVSIFSEVQDMKDKDTGAVIPGTRSQLETMLRLWLLSQDFNKQKSLLEYGYGKVPDLLSINSFDIDGFIKENLDLFTDGQIERMRAGEDKAQIIAELIRETIKVKRGL